MTEMVLPGTYIEVRPEGLIVPGRVTVGNVGMVGTASKGPVRIDPATNTLVPEAVLLSSYSQARELFGSYDAYLDGASGELTLVRALELAFAHGATTVYAVRVASASVQAATYLLSSAGGPCVTLTAKTPGTWGNELMVKVETATSPAFIEDEEHAGGGTINLEHTDVMQNARNRIRLFTAADGLTRSLEIIYTGTPGDGQVLVNQSTGELTFSTAPTADDRVIASYAVDPGSAVMVTLQLGTNEENYTVVNGEDLVADINRRIGGSQWVDATGETNAAEPINLIADFAAFGTGTNERGSNGEDAASSDYAIGLEALLNEPAHIIVAAGQDDSFGDSLLNHCRVASSEAYRRERIAVVGSALGVDLDDVLAHNLDSGRVIYVTPGVRFDDSAAREEKELSGAYAAAAVAGLLAGLPAHYSPTNKVLGVGGLEKRYTNAELTQLVQHRVLALEARQGFRVVRGITTSSNTAWQQITTRRIVDYAKFGVRSAANPFVGLLNNDRVRTALKSSLESFLNEMKQDEMLVAFELEVSATREQQRRGIVQVDMFLQPVFSIEYIKVTMFLE